jgi:UTP--glucose-1-phosphate uridylyltransferase
MGILEVDEKTKRTLAKYGFDEAALEVFARRAKEAGAVNAVKGNVSPPGEGEVTPLAPLGSAERRRLRKVGLEAIARGEVGAVILAGGMATRFGGVVKAVVPAVEQTSFLECKWQDISMVSKATGGRVTALVMSSYATHDAIVAHATERLGRGALEVFPQFVSLRLTPEGTLFREDDGELSPYATGHGDLTFALRRSGVLARFRAAGGKVLLMSNVDNLGATVDPAIIATHLEQKVALTAEVVRKERGDKGGAPARLDGRVQIVESFRFPPAFDQDTIGVFNTNTFVLDAAAIDRDFELPTYRVEKRVDGRAAIQFERLVGELTAFLPSAFVEVQREGPDGRFLPAKDPEELARRVSAIRQVLSSRRSLED